MDHVDDWVEDLGAASILEDGKPCAASESTC
jgi:hypothetical protein